jgi:hypothetical protein
MDSFGGGGGTGSARPAVASLSLSGGRSRRGLLAGGGGKEIEVVRENGQFGVCLCHAENAAGDKDGRVCRERWEVLPPLAVFEIHGNGKGLWGPRGRVVGGDTHAVVKERVSVV